MKTKNVLSIFLSKFSIVYKLILFLITLTAFTSILLASTCLPLLHGLFQDIKALDIPTILGNYVKAEAQGVNTILEYDTLVETIKQVPVVIQHWSSNVIGSGIVLIIIIYIFAIFYYMAYYTVSDMIRNFMSTNSKFGFTSNYIYNSKKSIMFALLYVPYVVVFYIITGTLSIAVGFLCARISFLLGLYVMFLSAILLLSLRRALTAYWLPIAVCEGLSASEAFVQNFTKIKYRFWHVFGSYCIIYILGLALLFLLTILTAGVGLIVGYVMIWVVMQITDMVDYYHIVGRKYYIDEQKVVDPKKQFKDVVLDDFKL